MEYESWDDVTMVDRTSMVVTSHITRQLTSRRCRFNREAEIANRRQVWSCRGAQRGRCRGRAAGLSSCQGAFVAVQDVECEGALLYSACCHYYEALSNK